jgi:transglycosylase-like protein with SLT domain
MSLVTVFVDANFQGANAGLGTGRYDWGQLGIPNDSLSSLRVPAGLVATLYENTHFAGRSKTFTRDASYVGDDFNDITSSIVVGSATPGVISLGDVNYGRYGGGGDINSWISQACQAAGLPQTDGWVNGFRTLCLRESSYGPNAVNTTDGNANGPIVGDGNPQNCSRGVAQCIPPTFAAYHVAGTSLAIYDPVANIAAASQYIRDRYKVSWDGSDFAAKVQQADPSRPPKGY